jgi:hypothetical protein
MKTKYLTIALFISVMGSRFLLAQTEKPFLSLRAEPEAFSPNNDDLQDQLFFYPVLTGDVEVTRWRLDISNAKKKRANRLSGAMLPALIKWDGFDKKGVICSDGLYVADLVVWGEKGSFSTRYQFRLDIKPPLVDLKLSTPVIDGSDLDRNKIVFTPHVQDDSLIERWQLQILGSAGNTVQVFWSTGPVVPIEWDGKNKANGVLSAPGVYRCAFQAWDQAGNESDLALADVTIRVTVRQILEKNLKNIQIVETPLGLLVPLSNEDLFNFKQKKKLVWKPLGKTLLNEVGLLLNSYADIPISIEGYSAASKNSIQDRDQASLYAWTVYSYLVKYGGVNPARISVRGRGRSPLFDRRAIDLPVPANGVEIFLKGDREW